MKRMDARLTKIEDTLKARRQRRRMKDMPVCLTICAGETVSDAAFDETGRGPLIIQLSDRRPLDHPISESDRPFIIAENSIDSEAS